MPDSLRDSHRFKALSRVRQLTDSYCGPASVAMLLSHFGVEKHQEQIVDAAEIRDTVEEKGISVEQMAKAVKKLVPGMSFWVKREGTISDLIKLVREYNYPVGIDWQGIFEDGYEYDPEHQVEHSIDRGGDQGHYSVVIDVDPANNYIRIADPYGSYAGKDRFFNIHEFLARWWDDREDEDVIKGIKNYVFENKLMFLVMPSNLRFPEELGMKEL